MHDRILVIVATSDRAKAQTALMYATNARKHGWLADVKLVFFGPSEGLLLDDEDLQVMLRDFQELAGAPAACQALSDRDGQSDGLRELGVEVRFVGSYVSDLIKQGYVPLVW